MLAQRESVYWSLRGLLFTTWFYVVTRSINSAALKQIRLGQDAKTVGYLKETASNKIHKQVWFCALSGRRHLEMFCCDVCLTSPQPLSTAHPHPHPRPEGGRGDASQIWGWSDLGGSWHSPLGLCLPQQQDKGPVRRPANLLAPSHLLHQ